MKGEVDLENLVGPHISVFHPISRKMACCEQTTFLWFSVLIVIFARTKRNGLMGEPLLVFLVTKRERNAGYKIWSSKGHAPKMSPFLSFWLVLKRPTTWNQKKEALGRLELNIKRCLFKANFSSHEKKDPWLSFAFLRLAWNELSVNTKWAPNCFNSSSSFSLSTLTSCRLFQHWYSIVFELTTMGNVTLTILTSYTQVNRAIILVKPSQSLYFIWRMISSSMIRIE